MEEIYLKKYTDKIIETVYKHLPREEKDWILTGFINQDKDIYTFGNDSKIIGRLFEVLAFDALNSAAKELGYVLGESEKQTVYPDFYFQKPDGKLIAIDIKTTYRKSKNARYGFTGGSFTSYMRNGTKNIHGIYDNYDAHYILGIVYTREKKPSTGKFSIDGLSKIVPAYKDIEFFIQEKYRICGESKGSGNTDNIGTITSNNLGPFLFGAGPFSYLGKNVFHEYWTNYPRYKDSDNVKNSLYTTIPGFISWVGQKNKDIAKDLTEKYNKYLIEYQELDLKNWEEQ